MTIECITLCSGGLDSIVLAHYLNACGRSQVLLSFDYAQRNRAELGAAALCASDLGIKHQAIDIDFDAITTSSLTNRNISLATTGLDDVAHQTLYFPNRNIVFLAHAFAYAIAHGATYVAIGSEGSDVFPDNKEETLLAYQTMQEHACRGFAVVKLLFPFSDMEKCQVVALGDALSVPMHHSWSCYDGQNKQCGVCKACRVRRDAFMRAGIKDTTEYMVLDVHP